MDKKATMALKPDTVNQVRKLRKTYCTELFSLVRKEIHQNNHLPSRGEDGPYAQKVQQLNQEMTKKLESMVQKEVHDFKVPLNGALLNTVNNIIKNGAMQD